MSENTEVQASENQAPAQPTGRQPAAPQKPAKAPAAPKPITAAQAAAMDPVPPQANRQPNFKSRTERTFRHDVFKCLPAVMKKNESYTHLQPLLVDIDHAHVYHTRSHTGQQTKETQKMGGHFHYVDLSVDPATGDLVAHCGPAMHEVTFMAANGQTYKRVEPLAFAKIMGNGQEGTLVDSHSHVMEHIGSEELGGSISRHKLEEERAAAQAMGVRIDGVTPSAPSPMTAAQAAQATIV